MNKLILLSVITTSLFSSCALKVETISGGNTTVYITQSDSTIIVYKHNGQTQYVLKKEADGSILESSIHSLASETEIAEEILTPALDTAIQRKGMERYVIGEENNICATNPFLIIFTVLMTFSTLFLSTILLKGQRAK